MAQNMVNLVIIPCVFAKKKKKKEKYIVLHVCVSVYVCGEEWSINVS